MSIAKGWFLQSVRVSCVLAAMACILLQGRAWADPTREEVYRNDELRIVVYRDGQDPNQFWYLPPLRWLTGDDGRLISYQRPRGDGRTDYYFYVVPYTSPEIISLIAREVPNITSEHQLRPLTLKRVGIRIPQFDVSVVGTEATDFHYINSPQLVRVPLDPAKVEEFTFFMSNPPGIRADVMFFYLGERVDRYIQLELSCRDVYSSMRVGLSGRYEFTAADIEDRVFEYLTNRYLYIRSKGDIPMPDIVNRAIAECFTQITPPRLSLSTSTDGLDAERSRIEQEQYALFLSILATPGSSTLTDADLVAQDDLVVPLPGPGGGATRPLPGSPGSAVPGTPVGGGGGGGGGPITLPITNPGSGGGGVGIGVPGGPTPPRPPGGGGPPTAPPGSVPGVGRDGIYFSFRSEMVTVERNFIFRREQVTSFEEVTSVPMTLSTSARVPTAPPVDAAQPLPGWNGVVLATNDQGSPLASGVTVRPGDQILITSSFALWVGNAYDNVERRRARWDSGWGNVDEDLYYRVGRGPWVKVGGRALIRSDSLDAGVLEFYVDRAHVWERIPAEFKRRRFLAPPALTYRSTFPEFTVTVTGRRTRP
jgi:hypothetical protein